MNILYSDVEQSKNSWDYGDDIGIIPKKYGGSAKDEEQDQKIENNSQRIEETRQSVIENNNRDDEQQRQLDANDALDINQQSQIDETIRRLEDNIASDERQQGEIEENRNDIIRIEGELPTLNIEVTTLVIGTRGNT